MTFEDARILEGTWEELLTHANELRGHRLRLIVLPADMLASGLAPDDEAALRQRTRELWKEADSIEREAGKPGADPYGETFGEILAAKYRKIGLKL